jgi:hypothetical protein
VTDAEIATAARRIALDNIQEQIDDAMGIGETLAETLDDLTVEDASDLIDRVAAELRAIRAGLAAQWGVTR